MAFRLSTGLRNAMLGSTGFKGALDGGVIKIFSGSIPADGDTDEGTGTLLLEVTVGAAVLPGGGLVLASAADGSITKVLVAVWQGVAVATGTAAWFRFYDSAETTGASTTAVRLDGTVGTGSADLIISSTSIVTGAPTTLDTAVFTLPVTS